MVSRAPIDTDISTNAHDSSGRYLTPWTFLALNDGGTLVKNEGSFDRALRVIVGVVLIGLVFIGPQTAWGWIGLIPLVTGLVGICPLYRLLGIRTCS